MLFSKIFSVYFLKCLLVVLGYSACFCSTVLMFHVRNCKLLHSLFGDSNKWTFCAFYEFLSLGVLGLGSVQPPNSLLLAQLNRDEDVRQHSGLKSNPITGEWNSRAAPLRVRKFFWLQELDMSKNKLLVANLFFQQNTVGWRFLSFFFLA